MKTFLLIAALTALAVAALAVRVIIRPDGRFGSRDVGDDPNMRSRGIGCTMEQDRDARRRRPLDTRRL